MKNAWQVSAESATTISLDIDFFQGWVQTESSFHSKLPQSKQHSWQIMKEKSQNQIQPEPCNLVSAKLRRHSNMWDTFESPMFAIEIFPRNESDEIILEEGSNEDEDLKKPRSSWRRYFGIFFAVMSSVVLSLATVVIKVIANYHSFNISAWRFQGVLIPNLLILSYYWARGRSEIVKDIWPLGKPGVKRNLVVLFFRGLFAGAAVVSQIYSLQYLSIADSTVICFSTPVFVTFLAHFVLGERLGIIPVVTSIFTLAGVVCITRPPIITGGELSLENLIGIGMALTSMFMGAGVLIILRFLSDVNMILVTTSFGSIGTIFCLVLAFSAGVFELPQGLDDWIYAIALGALTFIGQIFFTLALQYEEAGPVALIRTADVIFAFIWQILFFGAQPDMFSILGALIVVSGVLVIGVRKLIDGLPEESRTRQNLRYLLL